MNPLILCGFLVKGNLTGEETKLAVGELLTKTFLSDKGARVEGLVDE